MEQELLYDKGTRSHFDRIIELYKSDITELKTMCENATFDIGGNDMNYNKIRDFLIEEFRKNDGFVHVDTYEFLVPFWSNILGYIQTVSNSKELVKDFLTQQQEKALKKVMVLSCGKETAMKYKFDHRQYIVDRMNELKILAIDTN